MQGRYFFVTANSNNSKRNRTFLNSSMKNVNLRHWENVFQKSLFEEEEMSAGNINGFNAVNRHILNFDILCKCIYTIYYLYKYLYPYF